MAAGDILGVSLHSTRYGSYADIEIDGLSTGGTYNFGTPTSIDTANLIVIVTSEGFDAAGNATLVQRTLFGTVRGRRPYPNNAQAEETDNGGSVTIRCWLSGYVYADDQNGGAGTSGVNPVAYIRAGLYTQGGTPNNAELDGIECSNTSTLAYPRAIARWAWPGWVRVTDTYALEVVAFHAEGRDGKPVACVKYTATDEHAHSATYTVSAPRPSKPASVPASDDRGQYDARCIEVYRAVLSAAPFDDRDTITVRAQVYPLVGDADSVCDTNGVTVPTANFHDLKLLCDRGGTWGTVYAVVDSVSGNNGTAVASETLATAAAAPYATIAAAADGVKARYNTWKSRNSSSGGIIYLRGNASHTWIGATRTAETHGANYKTWLTVETYPGDSQAVITGYSGTGTRTLNVALCCLRNLYFDPSGTGSQLNIVVGSIANSYVAWADRVRFNHKGELQPIITLHLNTYITHCTFDNGAYLRETSTNNMSFPLIRGSTWSDTNNSGYVHSYATFGNVFRRTFMTGPHPSSTVPVPDNAIIAWNANYKLNNQFVSHASTLANSVAHGIAIVGNVFEGQTSATGMIGVQGTGLGNLQHVVFSHNTAVGERMFFSYLDEGTENTINTRALFRANVITNLNCKTDVWAADPNGARVNNWSQVNGVGHAYGCYGACTVAPEYIGPGSLLSQTLAFADDKSGAGAGNGDYRPAGSAVFRDYMPASLRIINYDQLGQRLATSGSIDAGAIQYEDTPSGSGGAQRQKLHIRTGLGL